MLDQSNAHELAQIAEETGALFLQGTLDWPGSEQMGWQVGPDILDDVLYAHKGRQVLLILAPVDGGEPVHLCGICGFVLSKPGDPCPRCALLDEDAAAALDGKRVADSAAQWLKEQAQPPESHPLELELAKIQKALDALAECPPLWWTDKLLWRMLRWFYKMRQRRIKEAAENLTV